VIGLLYKLTGKEPTPEARLLPFRLKVKNPGFLQADSMLKANGHVSLTKK